MPSTRDSNLTTPGAFVVGCNYWASHAGTNMWRDWQPDVVEADLRQLAEGGLQVLRVFPLWPDFQPLALLRGGHGRPREYRFGEDPLPDSELGQAGVSAEMLARFRAFADLAGQAGLKLVVGLLTGWMSGRLYVPPAFEGLNVLTDPEAIQWETRFVRAFVREFKDHPAIAAWDLGNECNVMAPVRSPAEAFTWVAAITGAIRREDERLPIVSGLHGDIDLWQPRLLGELTDLLTTHPYPVWTVHCDQDPVNTIRAILHSTAETRLYSDLGRQPCIAEELGTLGPMLGSDTVAADFIRSCLFSLWAHDCHGLLWWCAYDQELLAHAPYDWNTCERELGLIRSDRQPKPVLAELGNFRRFIEHLPIRHLPPARSEAVCLLSQDQDHWAVAYSSFVLARQAGFNLRFAKVEDALPDAPLYLLPSVRGVNVIPRQRWLPLLEKVRQGATLYISMDDALLSDFQQVTGLQIQTRERRTAPLEMTFDSSGLSAASSDLSAASSGLSAAAPFRLTVTPCGAEVLASEADGNPAFTRFAYGQGQVYWCAAPIERHLTSTPGGFHTPQAQPFWRIYQQVAGAAMSARAARKSQPLLGLTEHDLPDGHKLLIAINYSPEPLADRIALAEGWSVQALWYGEAASDGQVSIPANQAVVMLIGK